ncbi:acetyltransferase [Chloropicon primus]|uniref:Acetyltransferase n=3 Tax=Chloropicon primus TaxID=1764295 RepID=A0A5B8MZB1_9CHLO|nr:acetyltransferase [Chloropicon primus]UPR05114.1 acetyltransferase [Chloropicon primus]|eukprot:QDZ25913.1 acetyltransferase [Chloropicon primus]
MSKGKKVGGTKLSPEEKRQLPSKEQSLFRQIVKFYETKQYKKGLKAAEQILKKHPEHGETLSMKGLTLNCLERKEEAYEFVKKGLRNDLSSHVCWHVFGLLYRSDHDYKEAIKCYLNALRLDKENIQILRDLSLLQIQMRDLNGFVQTRRQLLTLRPAQRTNWIAFAVSHHLVRNYDMCLHVIDAYEKTTTQDTAKAQDQKKDRGNDSSSSSSNNNSSGSGSSSPDEQFETSEMVLYKARVMEESKQFDKAIGLILSEDNKLLDKLGAKEALGRMYLGSGQLDKAEALYRELIDRNPENTRYHDGLFNAMELLGVDKGFEEDVLPLQVRQKMIREYEALKEKHPKCIAFVRRIIDLHSCEDDPKGENFANAVDVYARPWLKKGVPSLFQSLKALYKNDKNVDLIGNLFESYEKSLRGEEKLPKEEDKQAPDVLVWVLAFLAQHYDYVGQIQKALEKVDSAISHTPTVIELYTIKSKIMKHAGHLDSAALLSDHARQLDLADRYLNCHTVKYMLRAGQINEANSLAVLFTKDNVSSNSKDEDKKKKEKTDPLESLKNLHEMQCMWYEYEIGRAYLKLAHSDNGFENTGRALHKFNYILKHFDDMQEDQFDFHSYCLRKMTLRSYLDMLKFEDKIYAHPFYSKGAWGAIRCYLQLHDDPPSERKQKEQEQEELMLAKMTPNERKKYKAKQRKLAKQKQQQSEAESAADAKEGGKGNKDTRPFLVKEEEESQKLLYTEKPLEEAHKLLQKLQEYQKDDPQVDTQLLLFEWAMRSNKLLMALQAVRRALKIDRKHPEAHKAFVRLVLENQKEGDCKKKLHPVVDKVMTNYITEIIGSASTLEEYTKNYIEVVGSTSMLHGLAGVEAMCLVKPRENAEELLKKNLIGKSWFGASYLSGRVTTHESCEAVHKCLQREDKFRVLEQEWKQNCAKHFPYSAYFEGSRVAELAENPSSVLKVQSALDSLAIQ